MGQNYNNYQSMFDSYCRQLEALQNNLGTNANVNFGSADSYTDESIWTQANSSGTSNPYDKLVSDYNTSLDQIYAEEEAKKAKEAQEKKEREAKAAQEKKESDAAAAVGVTHTPSSDDDTTASDDTTAAKEDKPQYRDGFDAYSIAASLEDASDGWFFGAGTDEEVFAKYLGNGDQKLNDDELRAVANAYKEQYGESLTDMVKGEFSGNEEDKYVSKINNAINNKDQAKNLNKEDRKKYIEKMAAQFYNAIDGCGTKEDKVWEVLNLDNETLKEIIQHYNESGYADSGSFEEALKGDFSFGAEDDVLKRYNEAMKEG